MKPFKGILYNTRKTDGIADLVCPPYDVIEDTEPYYARNPFNAIRLELPRDLPDMDRYRSAKNTLDDWLSKGVLVPDPGESIYVYEQEFTVQSSTFVRKGFIGLHRLDRERILTHEQTRKKAKADREQLIGTLKTYTSFIFGLYDDREKRIRGLIDSAPVQPLFEFTDEQSIRTRFQRITDPDSIAAIAAILDTKNIYIADGHHRLDVSYRLGVPYAPFYLTDMYDEGIVILPYHRLVRFARKRPLAELIEALEAYMTVEKRPFTDDDALEGVLTAVAASSRPAFAFFSADDRQHLYVATEKSPLPIYSSPDLHDSLKRLKVNAIHSGIIRGIMGIKDDEISFTEDHGWSVDSVRNASSDLALFLPPTTVDEVRDIAENGLDMPPKSTFFYPKILTGLVFYRYA
ncbi:MAG: hypothetical protein A4E60_01478 [Syntrophorhabdus sp. PtaB.Bin047]|nr:MAG: hypothetical protein A4E60_01478 [Syntrophorhabdus sp. PtaB.Bin047]